MNHNLRIFQAMALLLFIAPAQCLLGFVQRAGRILTACLLLFAVAPRTPVLAQGPAPATRRTEDELDALRQQLERLETQLNQLQQAVQTQAELIQQQSKQLQVLQTAPLPAASPIGSPAPTSTPLLASANAQPVASAQGASTTAGTTLKPASPAATPSLTNVETSASKLTLGGLFQGWYASGNNGFRDTFRVRRAEVSFNGQIAPKLRYRLLVNLAKILGTNTSFITLNGTRVLSGIGIDESSRILDDAYISYDATPHTQWRFGQIRLPLSLEGLQSSAQLDTVERALFLSDGARGGRLGYVWDLGTTVNGTAGKNVDYQLGVFDGTGENWNDVDRNDQKAVSGRLAVRPPFLKGLQLGGSGAWSDGRGGDHPRRDRFGGDLLFTRGAFKFKGEVMTAVDADQHRLGYYAHVGYKLLPKLEAIFRFDTFDPDRRRENSAATITERDYVSGLNYFINEHRVKLQFNYLRKTFERGITPSSNLLLLNVQTSW